MAEFAAHNPGITPSVLNVGYSPGTNYFLEGLTAEGGEVFYRTMSVAHAEELLATGRVPATAETFISSKQAFSEGYEGALVQFRLQAGTTEQLAAISVRDASALSSAAYPGMPLVRPRLDGR